MAARAEPAAIEEMKRRGLDQGYGAASATFGGRELKVEGGNPVPSFEGMQYDGPAPAAPTGSDDFDFSPYAVGGATRKDSFSGMTPGMRRGLAGLLAASTAAIGPGLQVYSGYRSAELQAQLFSAAVKKYGSEAAARKWVAPPGRSKHNSGQAADLKWNGVRIDKLPENHPARQFLAENVDRFGLSRPMSWEPWQVEEAGARGQKAPSNSSAPASAPASAPRQIVSTQTAEPSVMVKLKDGRVEPRLYSPYSGPILQAYNAAAGMAYQSEVLTAASTDLMNLSHQFAYNPAGFEQAAQGYLDQILEAAPSTYRAGIRQSVTQDIQRRLMGVMEETQAQTLRRANNASSALVDQWSQGYSDALAAGNTAEAERARGQLDAVLRAREAMPGIAWTPEQSAGVFMRAEREAATIEATRVRELAGAAKKDLELVRDAAKEGLSAEQESILNDPFALSAHPELAREAAAHVRLRDNMPEFHQMTPAEQASAVTQMRQQPISEKWQVDIIGAADTAAKANAKAWREDPVQRAQEVMKSDPPPEMPDLTQAEPDDIVAAFAARHDYMNRIFDKGYTKTRAFFSEAEAEGLKAVMSKDTPAEIRAAMAGAVVAGFGGDALRVMDEIGGDSLTVYAGKMMAVAGNGTLAAEIMNGQQILAAGQVKIPTSTSFTEVFNASFASAFEGLPPQPGMAPASQVLEAARAVYASRTVKGPVPDGDANTLIEDAIKAAMGQSRNKAGAVTGGVQEVLGTQTLLPPGVNGERADAALRASLGAMPHSGGFWAGMANIGAAITGDMPARAINQDAWRAASVNGSLPMKNGQPLSQALVEAGFVRIVAAGSNGYRMEIDYGNYVSDVEDESGDVLFFDLVKLMEAME